MKREDIFFAVCWVVAAYFALGIVWAVGFPPSGIRSQWPMLAAFGFFFVLPFVSKVDIFQVVSVERKLEEVKAKVDDAKEKVKDVQSDIRHVLNAQQTLTATVQSMNTNSNAVNVYTYERPSEKEIQEAQEAVSEIKPDATAELLLSDEEIADIINTVKLTPEKHEAIKVDYGQIGRDLAGALWDSKLGSKQRVILLRTEIEGEMKRLLRKAGVVPTTTMSQRAMAQKLSRLYQFHEIEALDVFLRIANGAVHAEDVPQEDIDHARFIGERLLSLFREIV